MQLKVKLYSIRHIVVIQILKLEELQKVRRLSIMSRVDHEFHRFLVLRLAQYLINSLLHLLDWASHELGIHDGFAFVRE